MSQCPNDNQKLEKALFHNVEVDYCPVCLGMFFEADELRFAKDNKDGQMNWLDFDIWRHKENFEVSKSGKRCPSCRISLVELKYDNSSVSIDFCKHCEGIWLDRKEFKNIIDYLKRKFDYEILRRYVKNLSKQMWEIFTGPETFKEELLDFLMLIKLFNYKFIVQHPFLNKVIENSQK